MQTLVSLTETSKPAKYDMAAPPSSNPSLKRSQCADEPVGVSPRIPHLDAHHFLNPLANTLACRIAGVTGGSFVDRRASPLRILRHMRPHIHRAQLLDEIS
jgi:hypothetical protein